MNDLLMGGRDCNTASIGRPGDCQPVMAEKPVNRKRYVELCKLGKDIADFLDQEGVKPNERCIFGRIMEQMFNY